MLKYICIALLIATLAENSLQFSLRRVRSSPSDDVQGANGPSSKGKGHAAQPTVLEPSTSSEGLSGPGATVTDIPDAGGPSNRGKGHHRGRRSDDTQGANGPSSKGKGHVQPTVLEPSTTSEGLSGPGSTVTDIPDAGGPSNRGKGHHRGRRSDDVQGANGPSSKGKGHAAQPTVLEPSTSSEGLSGPGATVTDIPDAGGPSNRGKGHHRGRRSDDAQGANGPSSKGKGHAVQPTVLEPSTSSEGLSGPGATVTDIPDAGGPSNRGKGHHRGRRSDDAQGANGPSSKGKGHAVQPTVLEPSTSSEGLSGPGSTVTDIPDAGGPSNRGKGHHRGRRSDDAQGANGPSSKGKGHAAQPTVLQPATSSDGLSGPGATVTDIPDAGGPSNRGKGHHRGRRSDDTQGANGPSSKGKGHAVQPTVLEPSTSSEGLSGPGATVTDIPDAGGPSNRGKGHHRAK